jgi:glucose/arabinose dehydrogenase
MVRRTSWLMAAVVCSTLAAALGDTPGAARSPGAAMDYGPFLTGSLDRDPDVSKRHSEQSTEQLAGHMNNLAAKAVNVRLDAGGVEAGVAFDTDLLRYAAGWTGGFLNLAGTHMTSEKGSVPLSPAGAIAFITPQRTPGWTSEPTASFTDPRPRPFGPLPPEVGRYLGLYRHGKRVIFHYRVGETDVLDMPGVIASTLDDGAPTFTRTLRIAPGERALTMLVCEGEHAVAVTVRGGGAEVRTEHGRTVLNVPARRKATALKLAIAGARTGLTAPEPGEPEDLAALTRGGPARWAEEVVTTGRMTAPGGDEPYVVDELTLPFDNPWRSWMRLTGFDFFADGTRAAVSTWNGDVWIVSGINDSLARLRWRRFAAGLYEPLGLKIVNDIIYVRGRDQITRLHDPNADGEADHYENFNHDGVVSANYHAFAMDLQTDAAGNFYYVRCGQRLSAELPGQGALIRVSPDGSRSEILAAGLRAANGCAIGPSGQITAADNQGNWIPACRINLIKPGGFYGYMPHVRAAGGPDRADYDPPLCWLPMSIDSSGGSQVWAPPDDARWGPLAGKLLHTSYGRSSLLLVLTDPHATVPQGGAVRIPIQLSSGIMRARFNPRDGQLYLCGLRAWQSSGALDGSLCRVRYTGKPVALPAGLRVLHDGLELTFTAPLDPELANDPESFGVQQWNYRWSKDYGSPDLSVADPSKHGRDDVPVTAATLRPDGRTVFLAIPDLKPVMQMSVRYDLETTTGAAMQDTVYLTINAVPRASD